MEMVAICPNCHVSNPPTNTACEVCKVALGANLTDATGSRGTWFGIALVVTLLIGLPIVGFQAHIVAAFVPMFYGPLIASYVARGNILRLAVAGGMVATLLLFLLACALHWADIKAMLAALINITLSDDYDGGKKGSAVLFGTPLVLLISAATCMAGASAGEQLSVVRRKSSGQ